MSFNITTADIAGSWQLKSFDLIDQSGEPRPWRENVSGLLIYTKAQHMSVSINAKDTAYKSPLDNLLFYAGRYEIDGDNIIHFVENATDASRIGKIIKRDAKLHNNQLTLTGIASSGTRFCLIWQRCE